MANMTLRINFICCYAECHYAEYGHAEWRYVTYHYAECRGAIPFDRHATGLEWTV
jgi:hypothetical protein